MSTQFNKASKILSLSVIFGQILNFSILPILSRLYLPEQFDMLAVYVAIILLLVPFSTCKYDVIIPKVQHCNDANDLVFLSIIISIFFGIVLFFFLMIFIHFFDDPIFIFWYLIPAGVFSISLYNTLYNWGLREQKYSKLAITRTTQAISSNISQITLGLIFANGIGLIVGYILLFASGVVSLLLDFIKSKAYFSIHRLKKQAYLHRRSVKFILLENILEIANNHFPILIIGLASSNGDAANLFLALRIVNLPISFLARPMASVFYAHSREHYHNGTFKNFIAIVAKKAFIFGVIPLVIISLLAPHFIPFILGNNWSSIGEIIKFMVFWNISYLFYVIFQSFFYTTSQEKVIFYLQLTGFIIITGSLMINIIFFKINIIEIYLISLTLFGLILISVLFYQTGMKFKDHRNEERKSF